jgi:hypothetical protein
MGLFDVFGKGGGTVTLELATTAARCGEKLAGSVVFTGGKREQHIHGFQVWFVKREGGGASDEMLFAPEKMSVPDGTIVKPGEVKKFPFEAKVPLVGVSKINGQLQTYHCVASMDIPKEVDPQGSTPITIDGGGELAVG